MAEEGLSAAVAAGGPSASYQVQDVSVEELEELRAQFDELSKTNALMEMENEIFDSYLARHHQVSGFPTI